MLGGELFEITTFRQDKKAQQEFIDKELVCCSLPLQPHPSDVHIYCIPLPLVLACVVDSEHIAGMHISRFHKGLE